jgi:hypothetical protein
VRKIGGLVLIGLGAFLLVVGVLAAVWAPDAVKKAPADTDSTTRLSGTAAVVPTGEKDVAVRAVSVTKSDTKRTDKDVVVYTNYTCLVKDVPDTPDCGEEGSGPKADPNVISVGTPTVFATDRRTGEALNSSKYLPAGTPATHGLVNKFPFDTQKKTYAFWDDVLQQTVPAQFQGTRDIDGLQTYEFRYVVDQQPAEIADGVKGRYSMEKTMWIDPRTGQIIDQEQHDVRSAGGTTLLDVDLSFTDGEVARDVSDAKDNIKSLDLLTKTLPVVGLVGGALCVIAGLALLLTGRRRRGMVPEEDHRHLAGASR